MKLDIKFGDCISVANDWLNIVGASSPTERHLLLMNSPWKSIGYKELIDECIKTFKPLGMPNFAEALETHSVLIEMDSPSLNPAEGFFDDVVSEISEITNWDELLEPIEFNEQPIEQIIESTTPDNQGFKLIRGTNGFILMKVENDEYVWQQSKEIRFECSEYMTSPDDMEGLLDALVTYEIMSIDASISFQ